MWAFEVCARAGPRNVLRDAVPHGFFWDGSTLGEKDDKRRKE